MVAAPQVGGAAVNGFSLAALDVAAPWLQRSDARLRVLVALSFALLTVSLSSLPALVAALVSALAVAATAGFTPRDLLRRLLALEGLMLGLLVLLPFSVPGETLWQLGPLTASREGLVMAIGIALKANAVVVTLTTWIGTLEPVALGHALARLGIPAKLVHLFLFTVRYLGLLHDEYRRTAQALQVRAFVPRADRHTWRTLGWLVGMLLVRSLERARRVRAAMLCRGFHGRLQPLIDAAAWRPADTLVALAAGLTLGLLLIVERLA